MWAGFPGLHLWWLTPWVGLVPLLLALPHLSARRTALAAFQAGCLCCGLTLLWLVGLAPIAGTVAVLAYALLVPVLATFWAINASVVRWTMLRSPALTLLVAPATWACTGWLQNNIFTGFGWVLLGYTQGPNLRLLQLASVGSVYAVTACVVAVNGLLWGALVGGPTPLRRVAHVAGAILLLGAALAWGDRRLAAPLPEGTPLRVGIVQGSFANEVKWDARYAALMWQQQVWQSRKAVADGAQLVVWSEAALGLEPFHYFEGRLKRLTRDLGVPVLLGANYYHTGADGEVERITNSAMVVRPDGTVGGPYDKRHLTPLGEYTPLKWLFPFLDSMIPAISAFDMGDEPGLLEINGLRAQPLICFESVFPQEVRAAARAVQPDVLVHITNIGWFGRTNMPEQDLVVTRLRAIENGLPIIRAANVGISCVISPRGALLAVAENRYGRVFIQDTLVADVTPGRLPTFYARMGDAFVLLCLGVVLACVAVCYTRASRSA